MIKIYLFLKIEITDDHGTSTGNNYELKRETKLHYPPQLNTNIELDNGEFFYISAITQYQDGTFKVHGNHHISHYDEAASDKAAKEYVKEGWKITKKIKLGKRYKT